MFVLGLFTVGAPAENFMEQWYNFIPGYGACQFLETFATIELEFHGMRFGIFTIAAFVFTTAIFAWWIFQRLSRQDLECANKEEKFGEACAYPSLHEAAAKSFDVFVHDVAKSRCNERTTVSALMNNLGSLAQSSTVAAQAGNKLDFIIERSRNTWKEFGNR